MFERSPLLPKSYGENARELLAKYHPIEFDHSLPFEERFRHMEDWWKYSVQGLVDADLTTELFEAVMMSSNMVGQPQLF